jgi:uncharacterized protein (TIGR03086 family)
MFKPADGAAFTVVAMTTSTETTTDLLDAVLADLAQVVGAVTGAQLHDPTPCSKYDVEQLTDHMVGWLTTFADGFADPGGQAPRASIDGYRAPADAAAEVRSAAGRLAQALRQGAATRPLRLGGSAMPGELALGMILLEYQIHGWDLARATGQPWSPPDAAVQASLAFAPSMLNDDYQGEGKSFAEPVAVADMAAPFDRLLGLTGRDPAWQPGPAPLIARFRVDGHEPRQVTGLEADWVAVLTFAKTFTSGITGQATTLFMSAGTEEGRRSYLATERITGHTGDGREGSVTVQHGGLESDPSTWFGHIVPATGTGAFAGWSGSARIIHDDQGPYFEIRLS